MANNERTVDLVVRARDQFSKVLDNLKKMQNDVAATSATAMKRMAIANKQALAETQTSIKNLNVEFKQLISTQGASRAEMARIITQKAKLQAKALELQASLGQVTNRTQAITTAQKSGFSSWSHNVALMQQQTTAANQTATALNKVAAVSNNASSKGIITDAPGGNYIQKEDQRRSAIAVALAQSYKDDADRIAAAAQASEARIIAAEVEWIRGGRRGNRPVRGDSGGRKGESQDVELYGLRPYQMVNLGYQLNDVIGGVAMGQAPIQILAQQAGQFAQIWPQMMVGLVRSIPQIAAVTAVLSPFIAAFMRVRTESKSVEVFTSQLALMADGGRYSAESLAANASEMQKFGIAIEDARKISLAFIKEGLSGDEMLPLAQMAKQLSDVAGIDVGDAAAKLSKAFTGNIDDVRTLDQELKFLTADQLAHIRAMDAGGDRAAALSEAQRILAGRLKDTVPVATSFETNIKELTSAWDDLVTALADSVVFDAVVILLGSITGAAELAVIALEKVTKGLAAGVAVGTSFENLSLPDQEASLNKQRQDLRRLIAQQQLADQAMFGANALDTSVTTDLKKQLAEVETQYQAIAKRIEEIKSAQDGVTASTDKTTDATEEEKKLQLDVNGLLDEQITKMREEADLAALTSREQFIENTLLDARNTALERANELGIEFLGLTEEQTRLLREQAGITFDRSAANTTLGTGMSGLVDKIVGVESGGNASAKNPLSSATGLGQFISATWLSMFKTYFPDRAAGMTEAAILALREDSAISRQMVELYARENAAVLQKAGVATTDAALYLAHFLGPRGAAGVLAAQASTPVSDILGSDQINANKSILEGKNASEVVAWAEKKMGISQNELAINTRLSELDAERVKNEKDYLDAYKQRIEGQQFELSNATLEARQAAITKALREEELEAQRAGLTLTKEQRAEIERTAGALFDRQNVEMEVNRLLEQRSLLLESLEIAQAAGDGGKVIEIVGEINATEMSLQAAIDDAIMFWTAMGGPGADAAILKLKNLRDGIGDVIEDLETNFLPNAESINERLADIGSNAFSALAEAIANGTNVAQAFFQTLMQGIGEFLIEIGKAIVKQALFNALSGGSKAGGGGGFLAGLLGKLFHSGGVVGRSGGSGSRMVNPGVFAGAQRFHSGGVLGLGPNEVPIIGLKDEEMLTRDDPRHVMNGGAAQSNTTIKNVNVFDPADVLEAALSTEIGEKIMLNFMTRRSRQLGGVLG
jgi:hypothetical protein